MQIPKKKTAGVGEVLAPVVGTEGEETGAVTPELRPSLHGPAGLARYLGALSPKTNGVKLLGPDGVDAKIDALAELGVRVDTIGASRSGRPMRSLTVGHGPKNIVAIAGAHPDEPVGTVTCLHLAERLQTDPRFEKLREEATFHFVPMANPDGSERNEAWFSDWGPKPDLSAYLRGVRRDAPKDDVEFGFPDGPDDPVRPENAAIAGWFDGIGDIEHYVSLHSMFIGGGALFLVMAEDLGDHLHKIRFVEDQIAAKGLPLHDKDRFGQKGFHRIGPGLQTAPTKEEMMAFFEAGGAKKVAAQFKLNSMQYVAKNNGCPLAFVSELPLCYDGRIASMAPIDRTRAEEELRFADAVSDVLDEATGWGAKLVEAGLPDNEFSRGLGGSRAAVDAMRGDVGRYGDAPATEGNVHENNLNIYRRRAAFCAKALSLLENEGLTDSPIHAELSQTLDEILSDVRRDFKLRHPSLEAQVDLQCACVLAGLA